MGELSQQKGRPGGVKSPVVVWLNRGFCRERSHANGTVRLNVASSLQKCHLMLHARANVAWSFRVLFVDLLECAYVSVSHAGNH